MNNKFSIIIPCHQTPVRLIRTCLASVFDQDFDLTNSETILHQDGDLRDLSDLQSEFDSINLAIYRSQLNGGISSARNRAIQQAKGTFLVLLDADDALEPNCLSSFNEAIEATNGAYDVYFSNATKTTDNIAQIDRRISSTYFYKLFLQKGRSWDNPIFHSIFIGHCLVLRRQTLLDVGGFDESFRCAEITNLMLRLFHRECTFFHLPQYLYRYRDNPLGLSKSDRLNEQRASSISSYFEKTIGAALDDVSFIGRVAPYFHSHFLLRLHRQNLTVPYVNYSSMTVRYHVGS